MSNNKFVNFVQNWSLFLLVDRSLIKKLGVLSNFLILLTPVFKFPSSFFLSFLLLGIKD
jgi:hypothetical protein